ncbi:hypothetical protein AAUPMB_12366 [Pasteurella multocida subsp. multocida str. Anand1_buffalo]|nr:hypothetical protein AAUPMB_12366 [Pasteurella multocida subsp. multocida str. Anand1_buffalo]
MTTKQLPSLLGGAMIIAGTAIGAGMLANPTATAGRLVYRFSSSISLHLVLHDHIRLNDP